MCVCVCPMKPHSQWWPPRPCQVVARVVPPTWWSQELAKAWPTDRLRAFSSQPPPAEQPGWLPVSLPGQADQHGTEILKGPCKDATYYDRSKFRNRETICFSNDLWLRGRKVGSLKRRVRSHLARWEMNNFTPLWREAHFESQNAQNTPGSDHFWKLRCRKSERHSGAKRISKSKL